MTSLDGKIALITGGSQGLGEQITRTLADNGVTVLIADVKKDQAQKLAQDLVDSSQKAEAFELDVSSPESADKLFEEIKQKYHQLDILINNAGIDVTKSLDEITTDEWHRVLMVNLYGPFVMSKQAFKIMDKGGQIVNICSTAAKRSWANASAYHASKWGLLGFSHAIHVEGREKNIKVTAVIAGGMKTPFILERFPEAEPNLQDPKNVAEVVRYVLTMPDETVIPEVMVLPMKETSWP